MKQYLLTQVLSVVAVFLAYICWLVFPNLALSAGDIVDTMLTILQAAIIPNAFMSLLTGVLLLPPKRLRLVSGCFLSSIVLLWGISGLSLMGIWYLLSNSSNLKTALLPTLTIENVQLVVLLPSAMVFAIILGVVILVVPRFRWVIPHVQKAQEVVANLFEYGLMLLPVLVFFAVLRFFSFASLAKTSLMLNYFGLSLLFVGSMIFLVFPLLFRYFLNIKLLPYAVMALPMMIISVMAGDSIAAIPIIARGANEYGEDNYTISRIMTLVAMCFPWIGELANLIFPIYTAILEQYDLGSVLSILSVGPFFMFTDPYIAVPNLLRVFDFPESYQVAYMTLSLLTDYLFEACEAIAVLFVVIRAKLMLSRNDLQLDHSEV